MRNVIVTGGSRGLGLAIGATLAAAGYRVIAVARTETEELRSAAATCEREQRGAIQFRAFDLTNTKAIADFVGELRKEFGFLGTPIRFTQRLKKRGSRHRERKDPRKS